MIITFHVGVLLPATLCLFGFVSLVALAVERHRGYLARGLRGWSFAFFGLWGSAALAAVVSRVTFPDHVHTFWALQAPLVALFLVSGPLLCATFVRERALLAGEGSLPRPLARVPAAALFLLAMLGFGAGAIVLQWAVPFVRGGQVVEPGFFGDLGELARWGLGGERPHFLEPDNAAQEERGVGHLYRNLTVPMGTLLIASWLWIGFGLLAVAGRAIPSVVWRARFYLLAPSLVGMVGLVCASAGVAEERLLDPRFFLPTAVRRTGIWTSEPAVMRSFGPLLLVVAAVALVLLVLIRRDRRDVSAALR